MWCLCVVYLEVNLETSIFCYRDYLIHPYFTSDVDNLFVVYITVEVSSSKSAQAESHVNISLLRTQGEGRTPEEEH